jgi:hypothetical protein
MCEHLQHSNKHICNIRLKKKQMKHREQKLSTYAYNHCNICNVPIYLCNIHTEHLQHTYETFETLETYVCNMLFQRNISLLLVNRGSSTRRVHWCRARGWHRARRSSGEGRGRSSGEGPDVREAQWRGRKIGCHA